MLYLGGKNRLGARIAAILEGLRLPGQSYLEPFVGGAGVLHHLSGLREASDVDTDLICMWRAATEEGWVPPTKVSEEEYAAARRGECSAHLTGFIKYACSWGSKPWGGYARGNREYARVGSEGVVKKAKRMADVRWSVASYEQLRPVGKLIYCDPPYAGTTQHVTGFDHVAFWEVIRGWSSDNTVLVSEYTAPEDFEVVAEFPLANKLKVERTRATERLFCRARRP